MALDFHNAMNNDLVFSLTEKQFSFLAEIFDQYYYRTGTRLDYYQDQKLNLQSQQVISEIIDNYIQKSDLNRDKNKTVAIIEFQTLLKFCINQNWDLIALAD